MIYDPQIWLKHYDKEVPPEIDIKTDSMIEYLEKHCHDYLDRPAFNFLGVQSKTWYQKYQKFAKFTFWLEI